MWRERILLADEDVDDGMKTLMDDSVDDEMKT